MSVTLTRAGGRDGAVALLAAVLASLLLGLLLPAGQGRPGSATAASSTNAVPANVTPSLGVLAYNRPATKVDVIVQMQRGTTPAEGRALVRSEGGKAKRVVRIINGFGARMTAASAMKVATEPGVRAVSLDGRVRAEGWKGTAFGAAVHKVKASGYKSRKSGRGIGVAVVDTGVAGELPDFRVALQEPPSRVRVSAVVNPNATDAPGPLRPRHARRGHHRRQRRQPRQDAIRCAAATSGVAPTRT